MEDDAELASVLAFVDAFEDDLGVNEGKKTAGEGLSGVLRRSEGFQEPKTVVRPSYKEPKYSTLLQRHKRAEIADLREQVQVMEARVVRLREQTSEIQSTRKSKVKKRWALLEEQAARELLERRRAEKTNRKLRARLDRQVQLRKEVEVLIEKYQRQEGPVDDGESLMAAARSVSVSASTSWLPAMPSRMHVLVPQMLDKLVEQSESMFGMSFARLPTSWLETSSFETETEIRSSTTARCSVEKASDVLWVQPKDQDPCAKVAKDIFYTNDGTNSFLRSLLPVRCRTWEKDGHNQQEDSAYRDVLLLVDHFCRRTYDSETGHAVIVVLAHIRLPGNDEKMLLRERFWKRITPRKPGVGGSITQTNYRIESGDAKASELLPIQASVMRALAKITRETQALNQEWLLDEC